MSYLSTSAGQVSWHMITIIGLGPGSLKHLTLGAWEKLKQTDTVYLRTSRHPCVAELPATLNCISFDHIYQAREQFDQVYAEIAEHVLEVARRDGQVVYAVPGDPLVGEASVSQILERGRAASMPVEIIQA